MKNKHVTAQAVAQGIVAAFNELCTRYELDAEGKASAASLAMFGIQSSIGGFPIANLNDRQKQSADV